MSFQLEPRYWECGVVAKSQKDWMHESWGRLMSCNPPLPICSLQNSWPHFGGRNRTARAPRSRVPGFVPGDHTGHCSAVTTSAIWPRARNLLFHRSSGQRTVSRPGYVLSREPALAEVLQCAGTVRSWTSGKNCTGRVCTACGRLLVEQSPEVHDDVRKFLRDLRAGTSKPSRGFASKPRLHWAPVEMGVREFRAVRWQR